MRPEKTVKVELEEDEKLIVVFLQNNNNQMEFWPTKINSGLEW
jgi:lysyl-tRNA synthetase class 2